MLLAIHRKDKCTLKHMIDKAINPISFAAAAALNFLNFVNKSLFWNSKKLISFTIHYF